ncbi:MAG: PrsW family intramembrane metalloprotease, partial [Clostridia bacterium]|nr:PrsW family intramembrane metalloprotease [Clostridia bacterium]
MEYIMEALGPLKENNWVMAFAALLPAIVLCVYIYIKDRVEKEPILLLLLLLGAGVLMTFPAIQLELLAGPFIESQFLPYAQTVSEGVHSLPEGMFHLYATVDNLFGVALIEEGVKWIALVLLTRRSRHFNYTFDGIVYAVFVSLGFAGYENILYTFHYGIEVALRRAFTAVPAHMFFGVLMGMMYSLWKLASVTNRVERSYADDGKIAVTRPFRKRKYMVASLAVPVLVHGVYDYVLM